jgi:amino acid transporter
MEKPGKLKLALPKLTLWPLIAAIFFMVAGGPFGLEDIVSRAGYAGALLILFITPAIWSFPTALMVSELSSAIPEDGGYYVWVRRGMGRFWGYQEAWLSLVGSVFDMAIYPTLFVEYLGHFAPAVTAGGRGLAIGLGLIAATAAWNLLGAKSVGGSSVALGIVLLAPFAVLTVWALWLHGSAGAGTAVPLHNVDLLGGILVALWNYMGWDYASTVAGEVERPRRTYPLAMAGAVLLVSLTYMLPVAAVAATGLDPNRWTTGGWADVARALFSGSGLGAVVVAGITLGAMLSNAGMLNALTLSYSRVPAAMAEDGFLPRAFTRLNRSGAPWVAILACAAAWALCLGMSFVKLVLLDVLLTGSSLLLEFAALVALRIREPQLRRPYRVPGGMAGAIGVGVLPLALLVLTALRNQAEPVGPLNALEFGAILMIAGVLAYFASVRLRRRTRR